jgi:predicted amidophosphoribosyltransferase
MKGVRAVTTERHAWDSTQARGEGRTPPLVCGCGQDLDVCSGTHCPRCGTSLLAHAA